MAGGRGNLVALGLTRALLAVSGLVVTVAVVRGLEKEAFAVYRWIGSITAVAAAGAHLGLWMLVTQRVARDPDEAPDVLRVALVSTAGLSALTGVGIVAYAALRDPRPEVILAAAAGAVALWANASSQLVQSAFHGLRRMFLELPGIVAGRSLLVASQLALLFAGAGVAGLWAGRAGAAIAMFVVLLVVFRREVGRLTGPLAIADVTDWVAHGRTFGATVLFTAVSAQADVLMLEALSTGEELALYAAPAGLLLQLAFVATILTRGLFPRFAQLGADAGAELGDLLSFQARVLLAVGVPVAVGGLVVAEPLCVAVLGAPYADAAAPFVVLLLTVPLRFLHAGHGLALTARDLHAARARLDALAAVLNVVLNLWAIPRYGAVGAAATTVFTDVVLLVGSGWLLRGQTRTYGVFRSLGAVALAAATMAVPVALWVEGPVFARIAVGALVYTGAAWLTGAWRRGDLARLRRV